MSYPATEIDKIGSELGRLSKQYAENAADLASDPYFREAVIKVSVSGFVWSLYHAFDDQPDRAVIEQELSVQLDAVRRTVERGGA